MEKKVTRQERQGICEKIAEILLNHYNEKSDHDSPYIYLGLIGAELDLPANYEKTCEGEFVDEIYGELSKVEWMEGVILGFAVKYVDGHVERTDEIAIEELDDDYLVKLLEVVQNQISK